MHSTSHYGTAHLQFGVHFFINTPLLQFYVTSLALVISADANLAAAQITYMFFIVNVRRGQRCPQRSS